jgi:hypothetical protein
MLVVTADRDAPWLAPAARELLLMGDVPPLTFEQRRR